MKKYLTAQNCGVILAVGFALVFPLLGFKNYYLHIAVLSLIHVLLALGLNLIAGYGGQLSLAQAAFFGIGAYVSALLMMNLHWSFWLAAPRRRGTAMRVRPPAPSMRRWTAQPTPPRSPVSWACGTMEAGSRLPGPEAYRKRA